MWSGFTCGLLQREVVEEHPAGLELSCRDATTTGSTGLDQTITSRIIFSPSTLDSDSDAVVLQCKECLRRSLLVRANLTWIDHKGGKDDRDDRAVILGFHFSGTGQRGER